jgi:ribosomal protein S18 acetylase RimI-like enzyme
LPESTYALEQRVISEEDARDLVHNFTCGEDYWCRDVDNFLQVDAWPYQLRGNCHTRLFSLPGDREIVGFLTRAAASVEKEVLRPAYPEVRREHPSLPRVPVVRALYMGIHRDYQGIGFGKELTTRFLRNVEESFFRPRYVMLEVYADNPLAERLPASGYVRIDVKKKMPRGLIDDRNLFIMALDLERD